MTEATSFSLGDQDHALLTRNQGEEARRRLIALLEACEAVTIDLDAIGAMTPSFADELLGRTLDRLGASEFRKRVRLVCTKPALKALVNQVLSHRPAQASA